jgi:hypothetical protein
MEEKILKFQFLEITLNYVAVWPPHDRQDLKTKSI